MGERLSEMEVSLAVKGLLRNYLPPSRWEALRVALQDIYRKATGEPMATLTVEHTPSPQPNVAGSLWDQLVVLSGYHITQPPTPDHEFVQVCNGDLRKMVELMDSSLPSSNTAGRWRAFEDTTPGYWGIELQDAGNDDDAILYPQKIHRDTVARIVEAHNAALEGNSHE